VSTEGPSIELKKVPLAKRLALGAASGALLGLVLFALSRVEVLESFEMQTLDMRQRLFAAPTPAVDKVAVVLIDDYSVQNVREKDGFKYPWPRDLYVPMVLFLKEAGAKAVVFDLLFTEASERKTKGFDPDKDLGDAAKDAGIVSFAAKLTTTPAGVKPPSPTQFGSVIEAGSMGVEGWRFPPREGADTLLPPIPELVNGVCGVGLVNVQTEFSILRRMDLLYPYPSSERCMISLPFEAARAVLGRDLKARVSGNELILGERRIPIGHDGRLLVRFYGKENTLQTENAVSLIRSFNAQQEGKPVSVDPKAFKDKIVFIGLNASGLEDVVTAPVSSKMPGTELMATVCANILGGDFLRELDAVARACLLAGLGALAGLVTWGIWKPIPSAGATALLLGAYVAAACAGFRAGWVVDLFFPAVLLAGTYTTSAVAGYLLEGRQKREVSRAFGQYLSPVVIHDLMRNPDALKLGGETREIAVYFSDIAGFSSFSEKMSPEELVSFLNVYLSAMTDVILDRRGVVDKYIGDAIMAFWGAPVPLEAPGREACLAVVEQRRAIVTLNERFGREGRPLIQFRTGLSLGTATVGNMGSTRRFNYTAMGDTVNLASRLEGANKFFGTNVMMTEAVRASAADAIVARRLGRVQVVGKSIPTTVYELLGATADVRGEDLERLERYHDALALLENGSASEAGRKFEALIQAGTDHVLELCAKKCREMETTGSRWDGVWVLTSKG
jgi:adenylate cyclase